MASILYLVVPCYNEQDALPHSAPRLAETLSSLQTQGRISALSRVLLVDDGSGDDTWQIICALHQKQPQVFSGLKLTRNRGHQNALLAGLMAAKERADAVISLDADLQDDTEAIGLFLAQYEAGCDIVYGVRSDRSADSAFKRATAQGYYKALRWMGVDLIYNHADYRLMSKRALQGLAGFSEVNLFLRGMVPLLGYRTGRVEYKRGERVAGESKYPLRKMLSFAWEGITSFSVRPLQLIRTAGLALSFGSLAYLLYFIFAGRLGGGSPELASIWFLGSLQLLCIGVIGEYIGKIYIETKARPRYLIEALLESDNSSAPAARENPARQ